MSKMLVRTILGVSIVAGSLIVASPASAVVWKNWATNLCLGVAGANMTPGTNLILWTCNGNPDQAWSAGPAGQGWVQYEDHQDIFKCAGIAAGGTADGTHAVIWNCNGADDQAWQPVFVWQDLNYHNCYYLQNRNALVHSELISVLSPATDSAYNGEQVVLKRLWSYYYGLTLLDQYWCAY